MDSLSVSLFFNYLISVPNIVNLKAWLMVRRKLLVSYFEYVQHGDKIKFYERQPQIK